MVFGGGGERSKGNVKNRSTENGEKIPVQAFKGDGLQADSKKDREARERGCRERQRKIGTGILRGRRKLGWRGTNRVENGKKKHLHSKLGEKGGKRSGKVKVGTPMGGKGPKDPSVS